MSMYVKKPIPLDAEQWWKHGDVQAAGITPTAPQGTAPYQVHGDMPFTRRPNCRAMFAEHGSIKTLEGDQMVCPGDWIITGIKGEQYPCEPSIFEATYDRAPMSADGSWER